MALVTLLNSRSPLASAASQRAMLESLALPRSFEEAIVRSGMPPLTTLAPSVLQINVGKRCNQACHHCHVDAGPDRVEVMTDAVVEAVLDLLQRSEIPTLDITGGAPELHPHFRDIVRRGVALGRHVIDRCNLTITTLPNYQDLPEFLAAHRVEIVASLPSYAASQTDRQRGEGVFDRSVQALQRFNALGYGREGSGLVLNLVTNPVGAFLPATQASLEHEWKQVLKRRYGIEFNRLFTITNMPISRYLEWLERSGNLDEYMTKLVNAFNPAAVEGLMCRFTLSVGWDGRLYDCDFNQMLELGLTRGSPETVFDLQQRGFSSRAIVTGPHCFGCTAGAGSSCGGATVK
jgi:radical SAM/Cys-rich protein